MAGTSLFTELHLRRRQISSFELESLEPIARGGLGIALSCVGGIMIGCSLRHSLLQTWTPSWYLYDFSRIFKVHYWAMAATYHS
jgi:hypothetical protein